MDADNRALALTFDGDAELYDRMRPTYPPALFDDVVALARLPASARIVEIGCGTGQATVPLAERGFQITCVELGASLAAVARRNLELFPQVEVITGDFETWQPVRADFDAVVAFTSFHWIAPSVRYTKAALLLRDQGSLAIVTTHHVMPPDGDPFFREVQEDYEAVLPDDPATKAGGPTGPETIADLSIEIAESRLFRNTASRRYVWDVSYSADDYIHVLETYSGHRALDRETRQRLFERIRRRALQRPGGRVRKSYLAILNLAEAR